MFRKLRFRLTFFYTIVLTAFLVVFIATGYFWLKKALVYELEQQVELLAREEAAEHLELYKHLGKMESTAPINIDHTGRNAAENIFYYVLDANGRVTDSVEPPSVLQQTVLSKVFNGSIKDGEVTTHSISTSEGQSITYLITSQKILYNQQYIGKVYLGKIITEYKKMRRQMLIMISSISLIFLFLAGGTGYLLAGQALIPIKKTFARQREFTADASHELRTPLSVLLASVDALQEDGKNKFTDFSQQVLIDMKDEIRRMSKIIDNLLTLARADAQSLQLLKEKFDLEPVARQIIRSMQPLANDKQITMQLLADKNITIYADKERLSQLMVLLIDNALKYTPAAGEVVVQILFCHKNKDLKIQVSDTGIGISKEHQLKIFERFYQVDKIRSREKGGTGLGLSIVRWIVESHGGSINVTSQVGHGSTFTVNIPNL